MDLYSCECLWCCQIFIKDDFTAVWQAFPTLQSSHVQVPTGEGDFHHGILFRQRGGALWLWLEIFKKIHLKSHLVPPSRKYHQRFHFIKFQIPSLKINPPETSHSTSTGLAPSSPANPPRSHRHDDQVGWKPFQKRLLPVLLTHLGDLESPLRRTLVTYMDWSGRPVRGLYWFQNFT